MSVCKSVYPTTTTEYTIPSDFTRFLSGDPRENFDSQKLSVITVLNNVLLKNSDLSDYPELKNRIEQGAITDEEFADFLNDKGIALDSVKDAYLNDFPVEIDYDSVKNLVVETSTAITEKIKAGAGAVYGLGSSTALSGSSTLGDTGLSFDENGNVISSSNNEQQIFLDSGANFLENINAVSEDAVSETSSVTSIPTSLTDLVADVTLVDRDGLVLYISGEKLKTETGDEYTIDHFDLSFRVIGPGSIPNTGSNIINNSTVTSTIVSTDGGVIVTNEDITFFINSQTTNVNQEVSSVDRGLAPFEGSLISPNNINRNINPNTIFLNNNSSIDINAIDITPVTPPAINQGIVINDVFDPWNPGRDLRDLFDLQEDYYRQNFSNNFNKSACGSFSNPFGKLIEFVSLIASAKDLAQQTIGEISGAISTVTSLVNGIQSSLSGGVSGVLSRISGITGSISNLVADLERYSNLSGIIQSLTNRLNSFKDQIINQVDSIVNTMKSQISQIQNKVGQLKNIGKGVSKFLNKKANELTKFFSKDNIDKIKEKAKDFFTLNIQQFEDLLPSVLNFLLLKGCGLASLIENILRGPVDAFKNLASNLTQNFDIMKGYSAEVRNTVLSVGGLRMTVEEREANKKKAIENSNNNKTVPGSRVLPTYVPPDYTPEEQRIVDQITKDGLSGVFTFGPGVYEMGKNSKDLQKKDPKPEFNANHNFHDPETGLDSGFRDAVPQLWIKIKRVHERLSEAGLVDGPFLINAAARSFFYQKYKLKSENLGSRHIIGNAGALDVVKSSMKGDKGHAAFIEACSDEGFISIVNYQANGFFHIDLGGVRTDNWEDKDGKGNGNSKLGPLARDAWNRHSKRTDSPSSPKPRDTGDLPTTLLRSNTDSNRLAFSDIASTRTGKVLIR
jgi:archaellum component FlaC